MPMLLATDGLGKITGFLATDGLGTRFPVIPLVVDDFGGSQFQRLVPISELFDEIVKPVAQTLYLPEDADRGVEDVELEIDGQSYALKPYQTPTEFIDAAPGVEAAIKQAVEKLGITERKARRELFNRVLKERKKVEKIKESVFNDDDEIIAILIATDDL